MNNLNNLNNNEVNSGSFLMDVTEDQDFMLQSRVYLFAVARWLLCLLSDYKSATCSEM